MTILNFTSAVLVAHQAGAAALGYGGSSVTSLAIGTGSKTFAVQVGLAYRAGQRVRLISAAGATNFMEGETTAYSGTSMTVLVDFVGPTASGTHADWNLVVAGEKGAGDLSSSLNLSDLSNAATARDNLAVVHSVTAGTGISVTGTARDPVVNLASPRVTGANLMRNTNWQLSSKLIALTTVTSAMKADGTGLQAAVSVSSFVTANNQPTCFTSDTKDLYNGCLVAFGNGHAGLSGGGLRVIGLVPNTSFKVQLQLGGSSPGSSSALTAFPIGILEPGTFSTAPDCGWSKTASLVMWPDDFPTNRCPGAKRVLGLRATAASTATFTYTVDSDDLPSLRGRTLSLGMRIRQKVGAGTPPRIFINDGVNATAYSANITGPAFTDAANNNYQFVTVTLTVSPSCTALTAGVEWATAIGDIIYLATPTLKYGQGMTSDDLGQPFNEYIPADTHWNPPFSVPFSGTFPATEMITGSGLYGWPGVDIEAVSQCQCHSSVRYVRAKIESHCHDVNQVIFVAGMKGDMVSSVPLTFGLQAATQIVDKEIDTNMEFVPMKTGPSNFGSPPGCIAIFGNLPSTVINALTFDFDDVIG